MRRIVTSLALLLPALAPLATPAAEGGDEPIVLPAPEPGPLPTETVAVERVEAEPAPLAPQVEPRRGPERWRKPWSLDLRFLLGSAGGMSDVEFDGVEGEVDPASGGAFRSLLLYGNRPGGGAWGWMVGGGLAAGGHGAELEGSDDATGYAFFGLELTGGLLYVPTPGLQLEARPFVRLGAGEIDVEELDGYDQDDVDAGSYASAGLSLGMWYAWPSGFQLGGELGLEGWSGESEIDGIEVEASGGGGFAAIGTGVRW